MSKFEEALSNIPARGEARSYHTYLQTLVNYGCIEGLSDEEIRWQIQQATISTGRSYSRFKEIEDALRKARLTCISREDWKNSKTRNSNLPNPQGPTMISSDIFFKIAHSGTDVALEDLLDISDPRPTGTSDDWRMFLETLYEKDDILFLGDKSDKVLHMRDEWIKILEATRKIPPFFIINPLTGDKHMNKSGVLSDRCDAAVRSFKYVLIEFDGGENDKVYSLTNQLSFFCKIKLPIVALTYSGNKSIHALVSLQNMIHSPADWDQEVKGVLYNTILRPLGADSANSNPSRMSRLPGHTREKSSPQEELFSDTSGLQRLLYLNPRPKNGALF